MPGEFYIEGKTEKLDITDIKTLISQLQTGVTQMQDIISQLQNDVTQVQGDIASVITAIGEKLSIADFWSNPIEEVQVNAAGVTVTLPGVAIDDIPAGATILRAIAMFKFRMVENTNAAANKLNGSTVAATSQVIQVRDDTPGAWVDAINFVDDQFGLGGQTREGGDVCIGSIDVASVVVGNDGYEFRWLLGRADLDSINFNDVQVGIRVWYSTT